MSINNQSKLQSNPQSKLRPDLYKIAQLVPKGSRLLDVGCGDGELLAWLRDNYEVDGRGIEIDVMQVQKCLMHGLSVIHGDAEESLSFYPDNIFDIVVLSRALQAMKNPVDLLDNLLRVGKRVIISVPNFGHWHNRLYLMFKGRMPVTRTLSYEWYNTPNIHFSTIRDFVVLCQQQKISVISWEPLTSNGETAKIFGAFPIYNLHIANIFATNGLFVLEKQ